MTTCFSFAKASLSFVIPIQGWSSLPAKDRRIVLAPRDFKEPAVVITSGRELLGAAILAADRAEFPGGPPKGMPVAVRRERLRNRLKADGIPNVDDRTFLRHGIGKKC